MWSTCVSMCRLELCAPLRKYGNQNETICKQVYKSTETTPVNSFKRKVCVCACVRTYNVKKLIHIWKETQRTSITKINLLMLFKKILSIYSKNHTKLTEQSVGKTQNYWMLKYTLRIINTVLYRVYSGFCTLLPRNHWKDVMQLGKTVNIK